MWGGLIVGVTSQGARQVYIEPNDGAHGPRGCVNKTFNIFV